MDPILDVRTILPPERHATIFATFDKLTVGEAFVLTNDHDPRPLFYQMTTLREGQFDWNYLEQGPTQFRIRISRISAPPPKESVSCCGTCG